MDKIELQSFLKSAKHELTLISKVKNDDGTKNALYYLDMLTNTRTDFINGVKKLYFYNDYKNELEDFAINMSFFLEHTFNFYTDLSNKKEKFDNDIEKLIKVNFPRLYKLENSLYNLSNDIIAIKFIANENKKSANSFREYCCTQIDNTINKLSYFGIEIMESPLKDKIIELRENFKNSIDIKDIIIEKELQELNKADEQKKELHKNEVNPLQWYGPNTELIELTKALIENGNLKGDQKDIFNNIQKTFNVKLNNIDQAITKYNFRPQGEETKFLNKLRDTLLNYIKVKLEKQRQNR